MYSQLGTTVFDGLKSFVAFSTSEEAVLVEHALINRKPRLQGAGLSLKTLTITIFLHQEFCKVKQEISSLRGSKDSFEVLPLLLGSGEIVGNFVIASMTVDTRDQDSLGNTIAANVSLTLKEFAKENEVDTAQQQAKNNAFATGDKKPATKSIRVNPVPCNAFVSKEMSLIESNGANIDQRMRQYRVASDNNMYAQKSIIVIKEESAKLVQKSVDPAYPCLDGKNADITTAWDKINKACDGLNATIIKNDTTNTASPDIVSIDFFRVNLNAGIAQLKKVLTANLQGAALRK